MADDTGQSGRSGDGQHNPWAPPQDGAAPGRGNMQPDEQEWQRRAVAGQPTVTSGTGAVPPPVPPAPGAHPGDAGGGSAFPYGSSQPYGQGYGYSKGPAYGQGQPPGQPAPGVAYGGYPSAPSQPQPYGYGAGPVGYGWQHAPASGKSVAALVLGIIGIVATSTCWGSFLGIFVAPVAMGLGLSARRAADRGELGGRGQAVAGFVMGIVGTVLSVLIAAALIVMLALYGDELDDSSTGGDGSSLDARRAATLVLHGTADRGA
jgi:hypothetical protein